MNTEELTVGDLIFLPVGSVVEFLEPNGEPRYYETTKRKDRLWDCTFCPANHTSRDIASFKMKMRLKKMGDPEVGETITSEQVGVASHFLIGTRLRDADKSENMCWLRVEEGWVYVPEHVLENPYRTTSEFLREDYAPYTVLPKAEAKEAELPRLNEKGDAPEKTEFTAAEASRMRGVIFQDAGGDFWKNFDGYWKFRSIAYSKYLSADETPSRVLSSDYEPYTFLGYREDELDEEDGVPRFDTSEPSKNTAATVLEYHFSTDAGPAFSEEVKSLYGNEDIEVEKTPTITESLNKIAKSLERIANALEEK